MTENKKWKVQHRWDTAANWRLLNPVLLAGEKGIVSDSPSAKREYRVGDGTTPWNDLPASYDWDGKMPEVPAVDVPTKLSQLAPDTSSQHFTKAEKDKLARLTPGGGGSGATKYAELPDKPKINGHVLEGNQTSVELGIKDGKDGAPGKGLTILGTYASLEALRAAVPSPSVGDAYNVGSAAPYNIYIYDGVAKDWKDNGKISAATVDVVNDITTGGADKALSAEQGKNLGNNINIISNNLQRTENLYDNTSLSNNFQGGYVNILGDVIKNPEWSLAYIKVQRGETYSFWAAKKNIFTGEDTKTIGIFKQSNPQIGFSALKDKNGKAIILMADSKQSVDCIGYSVTVPNVVYENETVYSGDIYLYINTNIEPLRADTDVRNSLTFVQGKYITGYIPYLGPKGAVYKDENPLRGYTLFTERTPNLYDNDSSLKNVLVGGYVHQDLNMVKSGFVCASVEVERGKVYSLWADKGAYYSDRTVNNMGIFEAAMPFINEKPLTDAGGSALTFRATEVSDSGIGRKFTVPSEIYKDGTLYEGSIYLYFNLDFGDVVPDTNIRHTFTIVEGNSSFGYLPFKRITQNAYLSDVAKAQSQRYNGKHFVTAGDSRTWGTEGGYVKYIADRLGCVLTNLGNSGANTGRLVGILTEIKDRDSYSPKQTPNYDDVAGISVMIGVNDGTVTGSIADLPSGNVYDSESSYLDYFNSFPNTTYGNVALCIEWLMWKNPSMTIYLVAEPKLSSMIELEKKVHQCMKEIAEYYSVVFIDAYSECQFNNKNTNIYSYDRLHFNALGNKVFGTYLAEQIANR